MDVRSIIWTAALVIFVGLQWTQRGSSQLWVCGLVAFLAALFWLQLLAWKNWANAYKAWVAAHCSCAAPGNDPAPTEPGWP